MKSTYGLHNLAHLGVTQDRYCELPDNFDLMADYSNPRSYKAYETDNCGRRVNNKPIRVKVDHDATGTGTPGIGDIVVRRV